MNENEVDAELDVHRRMGFAEMKKWYDKTPAAVAAPKAEEEAEAAEVTV
jgi:hypothetical protein